MSGGGEIGAKAQRDRRGSGKEAATNVWMQGKCCDRVIDPETGEGQYFICGGIDTCDETRVGEFIGTVGAVLFIVLAPIMFIAGIVALIVFGI